MVDLRLYALLDPERAGGHDLAELGRKVVAGGATLVQLRDKHGSTRRMIDETRAIKAALTSGRTTCRSPRRGGCSDPPRSSAFR
jgi:thiamine monophosphate synthase